MSSKRTVYYSIFFVAISLACIGADALLAKKGIWRTADSVAPGSERPAPAETSVVDIEWSGGRYSTHAGFSVEVPRGSRIREFPQDLRTETGEIRHVAVTGPDGRTLLNARLLSKGAGAQAEDGCCEYFGQRLDLSASDADVVRLLTVAMRTVYAFRRTSVGGAGAVRFYGVRGYADGTLVEHVIVPTDANGFSALHFERFVGPLWAAGEAEPDLDSGAILSHEDQKRLADFDAMLATVKMIPIPAQ